MAAVGVGQLLNLNNVTRYAAEDAVARYRRRGRLIRPLGPRNPKLHYFAWRASGALFALMGGVLLASAFIGPTH